MAGVCVFSSRVQLCLTSLPAVFSVLALAIVHIVFISQVRKMSFKYLNKYCFE